VLAIRSRTRMLHAMTRVPRTGFATTALCGRYLTDAATFLGAIPAYLITCRRCWVLMLGSAQRMTKAVEKYRNRNA